MKKINQEPEEGEYLDEKIIPSNMRKPLLISAYGLMFIPYIKDFNEVNEWFNKYYEKFKQINWETVLAAGSQLLASYGTELGLACLMGASFIPWYLTNKPGNETFYYRFNKKPELLNSIKEENLEERLDLEETKYEDLENKGNAIIEDKDFPLWRILGYIGSLPTKAFFMSWEVSNYVKPKTKKSIEDILKRDSKIKGLTVRLNHTNPIKDTKRLFTEKQLKERNSLLFRIFLGIPTTILGGFLAKLRRSDHYNPFTKTVIVYSNIEAIAKHEIGHHRDFMRFSEDGVYSVARIFPPITLYQEWRASKYAKWTLRKKTRNQFGRFLIPAYVTYILDAVCSIYLGWEYIAKKFL